MSWGDIAKQFVESEKDPDKYRVFVNTVLGETWAQRGDAPEWERLFHRRDTYATNTVPAEGLLLTAGVDVQKDRIVVEVVAWGRGKRSWSIDFAEIPGDTADLDDGPWSQLDELLARQFPHESGAPLTIRMLAVDSGYNTQTVYAWTRKYPMNRVIAVKGHDNGGVLIGTPSPVEVFVNGRRSKRGGRVWPVCSSIAKSELYGWLRLEVPVDGSQPAPGFCRWPEYGEEYFKQLTAEQLVAHRTRRNYVRLK
jgi:phage terminase large subunit GpA-like protein